VPLIFHRKQKGKTSKRWTTRVGKRWITLDSLDASEAREQAIRLRAENVVDDLEAAAFAVNHQDEARPPAGPSPPPPPAPPAAATSRPVIPEVVALENVAGTNGPGSDAGGTGHTNGAAGAGGFAADINAAAGEASGGKTEAGPEDFDPEELDDFLDDIIAQGGALAVEVQLRLQEWAWRRYAKIQAAPVPPAHPSRAAGAKLWERALRRWLPKKIPIPDWVAAIAVVAMQTTKVQLGEGAHQVGNPPPAAAAGAPTVDDGYREAA